jgi:hypothetical protein
LVLAALGLAAASCAKEKGEGAEAPTIERRPGSTGRRPPFYAQPTHTAPAPNPAPTATVTPPPAASSAAPPPASASASAKPPSGMSAADLIKYQDACWKSCDQFACMKIAEAYRTGVGLPQDVLAGRRYAVHACSECGTPTVAIADQCPTWGLGASDAKK